MPSSLELKKSPRCAPQWKQPTSPSAPRPRSATAPRCCTPYPGPRWQTAGWPSGPSSGGEWRLGQGHWLAGSWSNCLEGFQRGAPQHAHLKTPCESLKYGAFSPAMQRRCCSSASSPRVTHTGSNSGSLTFFRGHSFALLGMAGHLRPAPRPLRSAADGCRAGQPEAWMDLISRCTLPLTPSAHTAMVFRSFRVAASGQYFSLSWHVLMGSPVASSQ
mmetsp:Transcript_20608/g.62100  ORF Transcript_20608/g.62100 Transcript_20608/m.62100 type:complete len:217 (+) Transcript_20608:325-975(+)